MFLIQVGLLKQVKFKGKRARKEDQEKGKKNIQYNFMRILSKSKFSRKLLTTPGKLKEERHARGRHGPSDPKSTRECVHSKKASKASIRFGLLYFSNPHLRRNEVSV